MVFTNLSRAGGRGGGGGVGPHALGQTQFFHPAQRADVTARAGQGEKMGLPRMGVIKSGGGCAGGDSRR